MEEMSWRNLEDKLNRKKLNLINVPYEKERLKVQIESFESLISKAITMTMKTQSNTLKGNKDPDLQNYKLR